MAINGAAFDVDFDNSDIEKGFGLSGFATNGTWLIQASGLFAEYEAKEKEKNGLGRFKNNFEQTAPDLTFGYVLYREGAIVITPFVGLEYTKHEWDFKGINDTDDTWTDGVIGVMLDYKINEAWTWKNSAKYAGGDSEGCSGLSTCLAWKFAENWVTGATLSFESDEFEGSNGYEYDTDVTSLIFSIAYAW